DECGIPDEQCLSLKDCRDIGPGACPRFFCELSEFLARMLQCLAQPILFTWALARLDPRRAAARAGRLAVVRSPDAHEASHAGPRRSSAPLENTLSHQGCLTNRARSHLPARRRAAQRMSLRGPGGRHC